MRAGVWKAAIVVAGLGLVVALGHAVAGQGAGQQVGLEVEAGQDKGPICRTVSLEAQFMMELGL